MSPWIIGFSVFIVYPMVSSLYFSFTHYDLIGSPIWIGLDNYKYMFTEDALFWQAIRNTVWFIVVAVPLQIVFAIFTATLLTRPRRGVKVYRTLFFLPAIAPLVAAALAFLFLFNPVVRRRSNRVPLGRGHGAPADVVLLPDLVEVGARDPRVVGGGGGDDHLPRRRSSTCRSSCTRPPTSREPARGRSSVASPSR